MNRTADELHETEIRNITWIAFFSNSSLTALKFTVGILGNSQSVVADAWHSLSDLATDILILFGVKFWTAPPDGNHPYGHLRIEAVVTTLMGFVLLAVGARIGSHAILTMDDEHSLPNWIAMIGPIAAILIKTWLYKVTISFGEKIKSSSVTANANHQLSDVLSSMPALIGCVVPVFFPSLAVIDHIGAAIVAVFILNLGFAIMGPAVMELTDIGLKEDDIRVVSETAGRVEGVQGVQNVRSRRMGAGFFVDLTILVRGDLSISDGSAIAKRVAGLLLREGPEVKDTIVQIKPANPAGQVRTVNQLGQVKNGTLPPMPKPAETPDLREFIKTVNQRIFPQPRDASGGP